MLAMIFASAASGRVPGCTLQWGEPPCRKAERSRDGLQGRGVLFHC